VDDDHDRLEPCESPRDAGSRDRLRTGSVALGPRPSPWSVLGDLDEFGSHVWDKAPLHRLAAAGFDLASIISLEDLDRLISSRHAYLRLLDDGTYVDEGVYRERGLRRTDGRTWLSDPGAILARFRAGATIVLPSVHEIWAPMATLTAHLACLVDAQVGASLFVSPPGSLSEWHADNGHLFVLHLYGAKHWLVERDGPAGHPQTSPPLAVTVHPGDVLYVPTGFLHRVRGGDEPAVHLSFYSAGATWADLIKSALASRIDQLSNAALRRNPPNPRWGAASRVLWTATLDDLMTDVEQVVTGVREAVPHADASSLAPGRIRPPLPPGSREGALLDAFEALRVTVETRLSVRPDSDAALEPGPGALALRFGDRSLEFPVSFFDALSRIVAGFPFAPTGIGLADDQALVLVRQLVAEGLLERSMTQEPG